jgi:hypothetical protein
MNRVIEFVPADEILLSAQYIAGYFHNFHAALFLKKNYLKTKQNLHQIFYFFLKYLFVSVACL